MSYARYISALIAAAAIAFPAIASAQTDAAPAAQTPSYSQPPSYGSSEDVVRGQIVSFDGGLNLRVRDDKGYIDNISLHEGTVINPTGLRLATGMSVSVRGVNRGNVLDANEIDTPYQSYGSYAVPAYVYPAYPYYGYPYPVAAYPYGPNFSLGIGIGFGPRYGFGRFR